MTHKPRPPAAPAERTETAREAIRRLLAQAPATAKELSRGAGVREKDVEEHLEHLQKSLHSEGLKLVVEPATCLSCGYLFVKRTRLSRPGACPKCRGTHLEAPVFSIAQER